MNLQEALAQDPNAGPRPLNIDEVKAKHLPKRTQASEKPNKKGRGQLKNLKQQLKLALQLSAANPPLPHEQAMTVYEKIAELRKNIDEIKYNSRP